jgi:hypothetical protein
MPIERTKTQQTPGLLSTPSRKGRGGEHDPQTPTGVKLHGVYRDESKTRTAGVTPGPAQYTINAIGCSSETYRVVKPEEQPLWHDLLASSDFLSEHSRQERDSLQAVMAQKPVWTGGPECCSWAGLCDLPSHPESEGEESGRWYK